MNRQPYLSFVIAARNDDYGGHFLHRIKTFFTVLLFYIKKYQLDSEIIVVEWNPPPKTPRLYQELQTLIKNSPATIRFIEVPPSIHKKIANSDKIPIFEYIAKNVGIRRARGEYILVTNPDILFPEELMYYLSQKALDSGSFYRVDRFDVNQLVPLSLPVEKKIAFAKIHSFRLNSLTYSVSLVTQLPFRLRSWLGYLEAFIRRYATRHQNYFENYLHTNAAGDFFLMIRKNWHLLRGYPELPTHYLIDGYLCCMAKSMGLEQKILTLPLVIFHSEHNRPTSKRPKTLYEVWRNDCKEMLTNKKPKMFNSPLWGLRNKRLIEHTIVP